MAANAPRGAARWPPKSTIPAMPHTVPVLDDGARPPEADESATPGQGDAPPIIADETEFDEAGQPLPRQIIQPEAGLRGKLCPDYARSAAQLGRKRLIGSFHGLQLLGLKYWRFPCQHAAEVGVQAPSIEFPPPPDIAGGPDAEAKIGEIGPISLVVPALEPRPGVVRD